MRQMAQDAPDLPVVGAPITSELAELELQLSRELAPQPAEPVLWSKPAGTPVSDASHLAELMGRLSAQEFGFAIGGVSTGERWGQVFNVAERGEASTYIVEVHNGGSNDFAQRVFRGDRASDYPAAASGKRPLHDFELFPAAAAARLVWDWIHVGLPAGVLRTLRHLDAAQHRQYGLD